MLARPRESYAILSEEEVFLGSSRRDLERRLESARTELEQWNRVKRQAAFDAAHRPSRLTVDLLEGQFAEFLTGHPTLAEIWGDVVAEEYRPPSWGLSRRPRDGMLH